MASSSPWWAPGPRRRLGALLEVGAVEVSTPLLTAFSSGSLRGASGPRRRLGAPASPPLRRLLRRHALGSLVRLVRTLVRIRSSWRRLSSVVSREVTPQKGLCYGPTRGSPLVDCPRQDAPGAPHRPVLPGWSPLFAGSPCPIPHRGAHASLTTALARGGKWSLPASRRPLRATLSGCFQLYWEQKNLW